MPFSGFQGEGRVTVSFPFINLALCCCAAFLPTGFLNTMDPFARFFKK